MSFLIAPPFPWVRAADRRLDLGPATGPGEGEAELAAAADAMRDARVGGAFWGSDDPWCGAGRGEAAALVDWLRSGRADDAMRARFAAAVGGRRWRDPFTGASATLGGTVALLADWRRVLDANRRIGAAAGMARWKRRAVARFLWDGERSPPFLPPAAAVAEAARRGRAVAAWPSRVPPGFAADAARAGVPVAWVEDGFLRSAGLGAECREPWSISVDFAGPAFDPARASDLETLLADHAFSPETIARAAALRVRIAAAGLGKYGRAGGRAPVLPPGRRVVLAVGQVADDLSVRLGGAGLAADELASRVRAAEPDAWLLWRAHPDVAAGLRSGERRPGAADGVDGDRGGGGSDLAALLDRVDSVHVLSSLTGFEALLRGRPVTAHGQPFYAGWGLTRDLGPPLARRGRRLTTDELTAGALILYPRYLDPVTGLPCPPEILVDRLVSGAGGGGLLPRLRRWQGRLMPRG